MGWGGGNGGKWKAHVLPASPRLSAILTFPLTLDVSGPVYALCRSPWSNQYFPPMSEEGFTPPDKLRKLELEANELFDAYRELYVVGLEGEACHGGSCARWELCAGTTGSSGWGVGGSGVVGSDRSLGVTCELAGLLG